MELVFSVNVSRDYDAADERIDDLHREATTHKKTDLNKAIACLVDAKNLMYGKDDRMIEQWLRLPLFLQQAGRFDEAMEQFEELLDMVRPRNERRLSFLNNTTHVELAICSDKMRIYDKMKLACKREKLTDKASFYAGLYDDCLALREELSVKLKNENAANFDNALKRLFM